MKDRKSILESAVRKVQESEKGGRCGSRWRIPGPELTPQEDQELREFKKREVDSQRRRRERRRLDRMNYYDRLEDESKSIILNRNYE